jgi:hypothetical protein
MGKVEGKNAEKGKGEGVGSEFAFRESLLQDILTAIEKARDKEGKISSEALGKELDSNGDLRFNIINHRTDCLIAQRKILTSLPHPAKRAVREYIERILVAGKF